MILRVTTLRDKILLAAVAIAILVAAASMGAVLWVIRNQHLDQSHTLLLRASRAIQDELTDRKYNQLIATRQLATQKNLGSTTWYLAQYSQSGLDRDTLFGTYQQVMKDVYKMASVAKLSKVSLYDPAGNLMAFAVRDSSRELAGFVEPGPTPSFQIAALSEVDGFSRQSLRTTGTVPNVALQYGKPMPQQDSVGFAVADGVLAIESLAPIVGEAFNPASGKPELRPLGLVVGVQKLDQPFVDRLTRSNDILINLFISQGLSEGSLSAYRQPDWGGVPVPPPTAASPVVFNEVKVGAGDFYQGLMPLYANDQQVGTVAMLQSTEIARKNTQEMIKILALIALTVLVFIIPLAWSFALYLSRPLTMLSQIFRKAGTGNHAEILQKEIGQLDAHGGRNDELGDLTQSFVAMAESVGQKIREINDINASLEQQVEQRTLELKIANENLINLATHDALTGLANRRSFDEVLPDEWARCYRTQQPLALIMLDVDLFKNFNDHYGHQRGDACLQNIARILQAAGQRPGDLAARYGGEEFAVVAADTDVAGALSLAELIRQSLEVLALPHASSPFSVVTVSMGIAVMVPNENTSPELLILAADQALYRAKNGGRNRVELAETLVQPSGLEQPAIVESKA